MTGDLRENVMAYLQIAPVGSVETIAADLRAMGNPAATVDAVAPVITALQDDELLIERNGWLRLSAWARQRGRR